jgi:PAS domain S-box-containing protein
MKSGFLQKTSFLQPRTLLVIFLTISVIVVSSALIELNQSKKELYDLKQNESHTLLESIITASQISLLSNEEIEYKIVERLLNNAEFIKVLFESDEVDNQVLRKIAEMNNIFRINIFDNNCNKLFQSNIEIHQGLPEKNSPCITLSPIFEGISDTLIIGIKEARYNEGLRYAVAVSAKNRSAIVLNVNAEELLNFKDKIGFGILLKEVAGNTNIIYAALEDQSGILAAAGNTELLNSLEEYTNFDEIHDTSYSWQNLEIDSVKVFEAVQPFYFNDNLIGIFRLGLSLESLDAINERIIRRIIIIGFILLVLGSAFVSFLFVRQNMNLLQKQYSTIETYSNSIIQNVSDATIVLDSSSKIIIFNKASELLFDIEEKDAVGRSLSMVITGIDCDKLLKSDSSMDQIKCKVNNDLKHLLVSKSYFRDENDKLNTILVVKDLSEIKRLESQIQRKDKLVAMGELASGVAHEIRNPINSIGTIAQQLNKDFKAADNEEEYNLLTSLIYKEVKRVNATIEEFLKFARPEPINPSWFSLNDILIQMERQFKLQFGEKDAVLEIDRLQEDKVYWDINQIKQVLLNLIQNSYDAVSSGGIVKVNFRKISDSNINLIIEDNGEGISEENLQKIFNLYFTTKAKGIGIGLGIVQRIIYEHGGTLDIESESGKGTTVKISMPVEINKVQT